MVVGPAVRYVVGSTAADSAFFFLDSAADAVDASPARGTAAPAAIKPTKSRRVQVEWGVGLLFIGKREGECGQVTAAREAR